MDNPLTVIQNAMRDRLTQELRVKAIVTPGGRENSNEQLAESVFKVGWERMGDFELVNLDPRVVTCGTCIFNVSLESKNLKLHDKAMDFIVFCVVTLDGLQPFDNIYPLIPVSAGYQGHDFKTGYSKYIASFKTFFTWEAGKFEFSTFLPLPESYELNLELWGLEPTEFVEAL